MKRKMRLILGIAILIVFITTSLGLTTIAVKSIKLNTSSVKIIFGKTYKLKVAIIPDNATNKKLTFISANRKIASVDKNGVIKGIIPGKTVITVISSSNKNAVAKCNVTVTSSPFNAPGTFPIMKEKVTLKFGITTSPNVIDFNTNKYTKFLADKTNINLEFVLFPSGIEGSQKLFIMINANDKLPDVINMGLSDIDSYQYGSQGIFIPLNKYYDSISYYIKQYIDKGDSKYLPLFTAPDGNIYTIPWFWQSITNDYSKKVWINKTWLDKLGLKIPKTTDEFYNVLKAFKTKDPNGNGKSDEIPFVGSNNGWAQQPQYYLMNAFIYCNADYNFLLAENGKLDVAYNKPEWKAGLEYMNKLSSEGLLSPLTFTQDVTQYKALVESGEKQIIGAMAVNSWSIYPPESTRKLDMVSLPPLTGPEGKQYATLSNTSLPTNRYYITKDCINPEAAFKLGDYMWSEEATIRAYYGEPNVDWRPPQANEKAIFEDFGFEGKIKPILIWGSVQNSHWAMASTSRSTYEMSGREVFDGDVKNNVYNLVKATKNYYGKEPKETVLKIVYTTDETKQIADISTSLVTYVKESIAAFITGNRKLSEWDNYVKELDKIGLKQYLEVSQKAYDRMMKK